MVYINQSLKQVCAELEEIQAYEDEQFMDELDQALGLNHAETCLCGNPECGGLDWLLDGDDPFEGIEWEG